MTIGRVGSGSEPVLLVRSVIDFVISLTHLLHRPHIHRRMLAAGQRAVQKLESRRPIQSACRLKRAVRLQIAPPVMLARKRQRPFQQSSSQSEPTPIRRNIQFLQLARISRSRPRSDTDPADDNAVRTEIVRAANVRVVARDTATIRPGITVVATTVSISGTAAIPRADPLNRNPVCPRSFQSRVILRQPVQLRVAVRGAGPIQPRILQTPADQRSHGCVIGRRNRSNHIRCSHTAIIHRRRGTRTAVRDCEPAQTQEPWHHAIRIRTGWRPTR